MAYLKERAGTLSLEVGTFVFQLHVTLTVVGHCSTTCHNFFLRIFLLRILTFITHLLSRRSNLTLSCLTSSPSLSSVVDGHGGRPHARDLNHHQELKETCQRHGCQCHKVTTAVLGNYRLPTRSILRTMWLLRMGVALTYRSNRQPNLMD